MDKEEKRKEYLKKWRETNKEHIQNYKKEYAKTHDSSFKKMQDKYKQLQQENKELKKQLKPNYYVSGLEGTLKEYQQEMNNIANENSKLKDNWNKLKEYINREIESQHHTTHWEIKRKMQELERGNKFEK